MPDTQILNSLKITVFCIAQTQKHTRVLKAVKTLEKHLNYNVQFERSKETIFADLVCFSERCCGPIKFVATFFLLRNGRRSICPEVGDRADQR